MVGNSRKSGEMREKAYLSRLKKRRERAASAEVCGSANLFLLSFE